MAKEQIAILGGKGMLGTDLARAFKERRDQAAVFDLPEFDITRQEDLERIAGEYPLIINCAAYTNVDGAQSESDIAYKINAQAVGELGAAAKKTGARGLHISTDFVFDGESDTPYVETDKPNPINEYGKSKLAGEQLLVESGCGHCIMRVEWTYGSAGNNFVSKLIRLAKERTKMSVVADQVGSPTATIQAAVAICELADKKANGLFHFAAAGYVSRYEMAKFVFDKLGIDIDLKSCKTSDFECAAVRPLNSCFDCSKIQELLDKPIENWQVVLERYLRQL